jgi:hypothetical protein
VGNAAPRKAEGEAASTAGQCREMTTSSCHRPGSRVLARAGCQLLLPDLRDRTGSARTAHFAYFSPDT